MFYISICITLVTLLASLHFMSINRIENRGLLHKLITWVVLLVASSILVVQLVSGVKKMIHRNHHCSDGKEFTTYSESNENGKINRKEFRKMRRNKMHGEGHGHEGMMNDSTHCSMKMECCVEKGGTEMECHYSSKGSGDSGNTKTIIIEREISKQK